MLNSSFKLFLVRGVTHVRIILSLFAHLTARHVLGSEITGSLVS